MENEKKYPIPAHYNRTQVGEVWRVAYESRAAEARAWAVAHAIQPAVEDEFRVNLFLVDVQNTFCIPGFELFVAGRSGQAGGCDGSGGRFPARRQWKITSGYVSSFTVIWGGSHLLP